MPLLRDRAVIALKAEAVEGVAEALTAAEATLLVWETSGKPATAIVPRNPTANTLSARLGKRGKNWFDLSFKFEVKGEDSTADSVPSWSLILEAAGLKKTVNTGVSVTWEPRDDLAGCPSLTAALYIDGLVRKIRGARVTALAITGEVGDRIVCTCTLRGVLVTPGDVAATLLAPTYPSATPEVMGGWTCTLDAVVFTGTKFEITLNPKTAERTEPTMGYGLRSIAETNRELKMTLDPELELPSGKAYLNELIAETTVDFKAEVGTGVTGHVVTIDCNRIQWEGVDDGNRDDMATAPLTARILGPEVGGVEMTITKK